MIVTTKDERKAEKLDQFIADSKEKSDNYREFLVKKLILYT